MEPFLNILLFLVKWGLLWLSIYGAFLLRQRWAVLLVYVAFLTFNDALNRVLKAWFKEERPVKWTTDRTHYMYYGMPSGHAQDSAFIITFLHMFGALDIPATVLAALIMFERVYSGLHSVKQIAVGAMIGTLFAYCTHTLYIIAQEINIIQ